MSNDLRADLTADLLSDLGRPALTRAVPRRAATPAVVVTLTPMHWSLPALDATERGLGVAVKVGPWRVEVAF